MEGPIRCGSRDWIVEMVGCQESWFVVCIEKYVGEMSQVEFFSMDAALEFASWMNRFDDMAAKVVGPGVGV